MWKGKIHMKRLHSDPYVFISLIGTIMCVTLTRNTSAEASCGSASCFLTVGHQATVQPKDLVRIDVAYSKDTDRSRLRTARRRGRPTGWPLSIWSGNDKSSLNIRNSRRSITECSLM